MSGSATMRQSSPVKAARKASSISAPGTRHNKALARGHFPRTTSQHSSSPITASTMSMAWPLA